MTAFGDQLRRFRQRCHDANRPHGRLTQETFGELVGKGLGIDGYTGAAVSDWERGKTRIHAEDRQLLMSIISVLHKYGGINTIDQANQLLHAGNFRNLDASEEKEFLGREVGETRTKQTNVEQKVPIPKLLWQSVLESLLSIPEEESQTLVAIAQEGPSPFWPRLLVLFARRLTQRLLILQILKFVLWVWIWLLAWVFMIPSLHWPFANSNIAFSAVVKYVIGSLIIPALIGMLVNPTANEFWRRQQGVSRLNIHLYTQQGASIGFHLGYFLVFMTGLLLYTFGWWPVGWIELITAALMVVLAYTSARLVPYNLFSAFERLNLRDGWIFFIFPLLGPIWGYFFLETYDILLKRSQGIFVVLSALTILLAMMALRYRQSGTTEIPIRWWIVFWVSFLLIEILLLWFAQVSK